MFNTLKIGLDDCRKSNPRQYWKTVKRLVKENANSFNSIPPLVNPDGSYSVTDIEKVNTLNNYVLSISSIDERDHDVPQLHLKQ